MNKLLLLAVASVGAMVASHASAQVTQYTSEAAFNAAAGTTALQTFDSFAVGTAVSPGPFNFGQFTGTTTGSASIALGGTFDVNGTRFLNIDLNPGNTFTFNFAAPITSFGANFASLNNGSPLRTSVTIGGQTFGPVAEPSFLGFTSTTAFNSVIFTVNGGAGTDDNFGLDNLRYTAAAVPEPATWGLMILGFGMIGAAARSRKVKTTVTYA
ncbi:hypothetical protein ASG11_09985 [Sphingomonas sp. Leaf357]|uniref:PEPxxWA-CTERM sorting domain-containing protein n=1 Tax=Sphingomonas sp. Leaf357 TaxID=1736350 RepID=UPI0006F256CE|nr:PEPxxWA-CTERM sorting domain-containing protein [Sphingomonas sp. Leaf357]KQS04538.1 hypothetical protein ASG11_09985 [Sphingomonas sp. Leaf357]